MLQLILGRALSSAGSLASSTVHAPTRRRSAMLHGLGASVASPWVGPQRRCGGHGLPVDQRRALLRGAPVQGRVRKLGVDGRRRARRHIQHQRPQRRQRLPPHRRVFFFQRQLCVKTQCCFEGCLFEV